MLSARRVLSTSVGRVVTLVKPSSRVVTVRALSTELPANLKLADASVLNAVDDEDVAVPANAFPLMSVPTKIDVHQLSTAAVVGEAPLEKRVFEVAIRRDLVHHLVRYIRHAARQPKQTKRMSAIRGSNKKPWAQKGGGRGQVGHKRNSAWRGGQKAHGPVLRDYSIGMNKKERALATMMTIAAKYREGNLVVVDSLSGLKDGKTKEAVNVIDNLGLGDKKILFVDENTPSIDFVKATSNLPKVSTTELKFFNGYEVLRREKLVLTTGALNALQSRLLYQYTAHGKTNVRNRQFADYFASVQKGEATSPALHA